MFESGFPPDLPPADGPPASADPCGPARRSLESWVEELDAPAVADAIAAVDLERRLVGARRFLLAVTWADQHVPACQQQLSRDVGERSGAREIVCGCQESTSSSPWQRRLRICRRPGSDGTPAVSTSGVAEYAVHCGTTTASGGRALGEALDLRHRHPRLWRRVMAGEVEDWQARRVTRMASWLTREEVDQVDAATAPVVGRLPWGRCLDVIEAAVIAADPEGHEERRREHDERCYVSAGRYRGTDEKGNRTLVARTSAANVARLDALIQHLADLLGAAGDGDAEQLRRAKAIGLLANPAQVCVLLGETVTPDLITDAAPSAPEPSLDLQPLLDLGLERDRTSDPESDLDLEPEPEPDREPPTAVQLAAEFGRVLTDLAQRQGDRSAWDLLRPETTLVLHLSEEGVVARMSDTQGPLGPVGLRQLRDLLSEELPRWLVDHLDGDLVPTSRLVLHDEAPPDTGPPDTGPPDTGPPDTGPPGQHPPGQGRPAPGAAARRRGRLRLRDQIVVRPVLDVTGQAPVDAYEVPPSMREAVVESTVFEIFPWGTADARRCQLDHTTPYRHPGRRPGPLDVADVSDPGGGAADDPDTGRAGEAWPRGQTRPDNLGPLSAGHHNLKTHLGWRCHQPLPDLYLWQTPSGHWFRIDHTGTTPLGRERPEILRQQEAARASTAPRSFVETFLARVLVDVA